MEENESSLERGGTGEDGQISDVQPSEFAENVSSKMATIDEKMDIVSASENETLERRRTTPGQI